jgi:hypothetical protein
VFKCLNGSKINPQSLTNQQPTKTTNLINYIAMTKKESIILRIILGTATTIFAITSVILLLAFNEPLIGFIILILAVIVFFLPLPIGEDTSIAEYSYPEDFKTDIKPMLMSQHNVYLVLIGYRSDNLNPDFAFTPLYELDETLKGLNETYNLSWSIDKVIIASSEHEADCIYDDYATLKY